MWESAFSNANDVESVLNVAKSMAQRTPNGNIPNMPEPEITIHVESVEKLEKLMGATSNQAIDASLGDLKEGSRIGNDLIILKMASGVHLGDEYQCLVSRISSSSIVWKYHGFPALLSGKLLDEEHTICSICGNVLPFKVNTTPMIRHLKYHSKKQEIIESIADIKALMQNRKNPSTPSEARYRNNDLSLARELLQLGREVGKNPNKYGLDVHRELDKLRRKVDAVSSELKEARNQATTANASLTDINQKYNEQLKVNQELKANYDSLARKHMACEQQLREKDNFIRVMSGYR